MNKYETLLVEAGMADTRVFDLRMAVANLHKAMGYLDNHNFRVWTEMNPGVVELVDKYAETQVGLIVYGEDRFPSTKRQPAFK